MKNWINKYFDFTDWKKTTATALIYVAVLLLTLVLLDKSK